MITYRKKEKRRQTKSYRMGGICGMMGEMGRDLRKKFRDKEKLGTEN